jgi:mono/diheme cytochrome c family protein
MIKTVFGSGVLGCALLLLVVTGSAHAPQPQVQAAPKSDANGAVARGEYLANSVAMCVQCHSTRDARGNIIETQKFRGGTIPFTSPWPGGREWAYQAPNISGLPGFTDDMVIGLLTEGQMPDGRQMPRPPMPPFRMARADAEAIVAYLRSR